MSKHRNEMEIYARNVGFFYRASFDTNNRVEYEGWAYCSNQSLNESAEIFQICKHTYDANGNLTQTNWANNSDDFRFSWTLKATYF